MADGFAQSVKQQADIVRIIGEYVRLTKGGAQSFKGLCPFHKEKTPSFNVQAAQQFYHCFGCGQSGDVFTFVQKIENISFPEAVRSVAQKCGIPLPKREFSSPEEAQASKLRSKLLEVHDQACRYFEEQLQSPEAARAREYLTDRGLTAEAITAFRIGYAPDSYTTMRDRFQSTFDAEVLRASGLFSSREQAEGGSGSMYARFRKRITFPIRNEAGRVIAFTARALDNDEKAGPKYLNSPETPLYTKGHVLFNIDKAKQAIRQFEFALLVEGQMDCISVYMAGITNVLATSGTAFTEAQVRLLGRHTRQVVVNFDPDTAGANAAEKSIALLIEEGFSVKVVTLEGGLDPDRYVRERGTQAYIAALRGARRHSDYLIERARTLFPPVTPDAKVKALNFLLPHIKRQPSDVLRLEFAELAAEKLNIESALVRQNLRTASVNKKSKQDISFGGPDISGLSLRWGEEILHRLNKYELDCFLLLLDRDTGAASIIKRYLRANDIALAEFQYQSLARKLLLEGIGSFEDYSAEEAAILAALLQRKEKERVDEHLAINVTSFFETIGIKRRQTEVRRLLAEAELRNDQAAVRELMKEKIALDRVLREG